MWTPFLSVALGVAFCLLSALQYEIFLCSCAPVALHFPLGICVEARANQEEMSVLLCLLCPFWGVFWSVFWEASFALESRLELLFLSVAFSYAAHK